MDVQCKRRAVCLSECLQWVSDMDHVQSGVDGAVKVCFGCAGELEYIPQKVRRYSTTQLALIYRQP